MSEYDRDGERLDQPTEVIQPDSVMESLRAKHKELVESKTLDLPVPGWDGDLVARYRLMGMKELEIIGNRVTREFKNQGDRVLFASIDAIVIACEGLYFNRDGRLVGLSESISKDEPPIRYDDRLVDFLNLTLEDHTTYGPARKTVLAIFGNNDIAILDHSRAIGQWSSDTSRDVNQAFLESSSIPT